MKKRCAAIKFFRTATKW